MDSMCDKCTTGASGKDGHSSLAQHMVGPYPGHHIFKCGTCDERWIRHYGPDEFAWTRFALQLAGGIRRPRADNIAPKSRLARSG